MLHWLKWRPADRPSAQTATSTASPTDRIEPIEIPPGDPLEALLLARAGPVDVDGLELTSDALERARAAGVEMILPLIARGELQGALYLGARLSDQPYSGDDRRLLADLATRVAPAIRVAQLVREQQAEAEQRQRLRQELHVAAVIQQTLLPKQLPSIPGWDIEAYYRPAQEVGGDFYDFIPLEGERLGMVIGDVTDKGIPAALVMATARSILRSVAPRHTTPGAVLAEVNEALVSEIPPTMFVTCLYAIIDTQAGEVVFANAGHNLPYVRSGGRVRELRATGMPLGLLPDRHYEERSATMQPGDVMVLTSDGITEAHDGQGAMYSSDRLAQRVAAVPVEERMVAALVADLGSFRGADAAQEDDVTLVVVHRTADEGRHDGRSLSPTGSLTTFTLPSEVASERVAIAEVVEAVRGSQLDTAQLERLKTAVGEVVNNAIEHGNDGRPDLPVEVAVRSSETSVTVRVSDLGGDEEMPRMAPPDLEAKLAGEQELRGWGLFLVERMVDELRVERDGRVRTVEFTISRKVQPDAE